MTLSEKSRTALYIGLTEMAGEEPASEMLAHFPARACTAEELRAPASTLQK